MTSRWATVINRVRRAGFIIAISGAASVLSGCFSMPVEPDRQAEMDQALGGNPASFSAEENVAASNPNDTSRPGMIHIKRYTDEYTINFVLDATEENIFFVMDLPATDQIETVPNPKPAKNAKPETTPPPEQPIADAASNKLPVNGETQAGKHIVYAQTYFFEKKYGRALDEVNRALEYNPNSALGYSLKGTIHYKKGEKDSARMAWQKALELDPGMENVRNMLEQVK